LLSTAHRRIDMGTGAALLIHLARLLSSGSPYPSPVYALNPPPVICRKRRIEVSILGYRYVYTIGRVPVPGRADAYQRRTSRQGHPGHHPGHQGAAPSGGRGRAPGRPGANADLAVLSASVPKQQKMTSSSYALVRDRSSLGSGLSLYCLLVGDYWGDRQDSARKMHKRYMVRRIGVRRHHELTSLMNVHLWRIGIPASGQPYQPAPSATTTESGMADSTNLHPSRPSSLSRVTNSTCPDRSSAFVESGLQR